ncbi:MAG: hypothetical protein H6766_04115 [Candidatus Peribacteria bacterium]|nr:MAG: hypothetical protein H6766_04115 [Candidatus Peribacteria bacterium]
MLLLLSWIAPVWTGNVVTSLTKRRPIQERVMELDDELIVTDLSVSTEDEKKHETIEREESNNGEGDVDTSSDSGVINVIEIDKETDYNQAAVIDAMDKILDIDATTSTDTAITNTDDDRDTLGDVSVTTEEENSTSSAARLSPEEQKMLEEFERNTH